MSDAPPPRPMSPAARAGIERGLARRQRELAAEQERLADIDDSSIGEIRRHAAVLCIAAAEEHERVADEIDRRST